MYYATRVDSCSGIWFVNKTLKDFVKKFHDGDEILICRKNQTLPTTVIIIQ